MSGKPSGVPAEENGKTRKKGKAAPVGQGLPERRSGHQAISTASYYQEERRGRGQDWRAAPAADEAAADGEAPYIVDDDVA